MKQRIGEGYFGFSPESEILVGHDKLSVELGLWDI